MAQVVATNVPSLNAQNQLAKSNSALETSLQRLSSGLRINNAKDDAAGIAIASRFTAQINGYNQGARNAADAISLTQTAEGSIGEIVNNVQRIRELAVQSANATNTSSDRSALQAEVAVLQAEIARVASGTEFNGRNIIGASAGTLIFQVGANAGGYNQVSVTTKDLTTDADMVSMTTGISIGSSGGASAAIAQADATLQVLNTERANLGAVQNRFDSVIRSANTTSANLSASRSRIEDADFAAETAKLTKNQILQQAGISVLSQANSMPQSTLSLLG